MLLPNRILRITLLLFGCFALWAPHIFSEESKTQPVQKRIDLLDKTLHTQNVKEINGFADKLYEEEDYFNALTLYKYALYKAKPGADVEQLRFKIALCYEMGERWEDAENAFDEFLAHHPRSAKSAEASYRIGQGYFRGGKYIQAVNHFHETANQFRGSEFSIKSQYALGLSQARLGNWDLSQAELKKLMQENPSHPLAQQADGLTTLLAEGKSLPKKSPVLAGMLSIIPGLGKVYTTHYGGAIIAMLVNGGLGFVVYDSFNHDRIAVGSVFGALVAATYSSNIIGGYRSAIRYNSLQEDKFADRLVSKGALPDLGLTK